jgi:hypothetical protein
VTRRFEHHVELDEVLAFVPTAATR